MKLDNSGHHIDTRWKKLDVTVEITSPLGGSIRFHHQRPQHSLTADVPGGSLSNVLPYRKPHQYPKPVIHPPPQLNELSQWSHQSKHAEAIELLYNISRLRVFAKAQNGATVVPPCCVFDSKITPDVNITLANISFNLILMAPPHDHATILYLLH